MFASLFVSEVNGLLYNVLDRDLTYFCTTISPITEELIKGIPILFYAFFFSDNRKKKKLFYCGTLALLMMAITYHAIYNTIVTSPFMYFGFVLPMLTYVPFLILYFKKIKVRR